MANSTPSKASGRSSSTAYSRPAKAIFLPADRCEARNLISRKGNFRDWSSSRMMEPTAPVAPTTAMESNTDKVSGMWFVLPSPYYAAPNALPQPRDGSKRKPPDAIRGLSRRFCRLLPPTQLATRDSAGLLKPNATAERWPAVSEIVRASSTRCPSRTISARTSYL